MQSSHIFVTNRAVPGAKLNPRRRKKFSSLTGVSFENIPRVSQKVCGTSVRVYLSKQFRDNETKKR